jgi:DNA polymerase (family 10)
VKNAEIADALDELADLYELDGAVVYRVVAYRQAARTVRESPRSVEQLVGEGRATELRGVGDTLATKLAALIETGEIPQARKLKEKFPGELVRFLEIPGLGPKTARRIHDELGVVMLEELLEATRNERVRGLAGLGPKAEANIRGAVERLLATGPSERVLLPAVLTVGEEIVTRLRNHPAADRVEIAGSARRMADTCKDLDVIATATDPRALTAAFGALEVIAEVSSSGEAGARAVTHNGLSVDFRVVAPEQFGNVLQHLTGSKDHNVALREHAVRRCLHVSEYGIEDDATGETTTCPTEHEVYALLGLDYVEPELRENRGELQAALDHSLPDLITQDRLRGDLHCHTTLSDGRSTLEEMAAAAAGMGHSYLAVTDHSASFGFGADVQPDALRSRIEEIAALNSRLDGLTLLAGSEVNVHPDGSLDYDDELLAELDWVVASVHSSFRMREERMTDRIMAAMDNPLVDVIGHPTGRLLLRRDPYAVDVERLLAHAARTGTMMEINANPDRRDLSDGHARLAAEAGVRIAISTDAHSAGTLGLMRYGVATARRGWLEPRHVANTRTLKQLMKLRPRNLRAGGVSPPR